MFITQDVLRHLAPSVFSVAPAETTSSKYTQIPTIDIVNGLGKEGFFPVWAAQCKTRSQAKKEFTKHMLRFRHLDAQANDKGLYPELVLVNSHDGLSSYRLMAGIFRMVCSNGLIAGNTYNEVRVKHQGDILGNVIEGTFEVVDTSRKLLESADNMSGIQLNRDEQQLLAQSAHQLIFDDENDPRRDAIKPENLLRARRHADHEKPDLFTTFNVIQENVIRGGRRGYYRQPNGAYKNVLMRPVQSIDRSNALNKALWTLAEKMAELKGAA